MPEIWISMPDVDESVYSYLNSGGIPNVKLISGGMIDNTNTGKVNTAWATTYINRILPDPLGKYIIVVDWEGKIMENLRKDNKSSDFKNAESEYIKIAQLIKKLRPNTKVGVYGLPFRNYWSRNDKWKANSMSLANLLSHYDFISPSLYLLYNDLEVGQKGNEAYLFDNIQVSLKLSALINKPVYPFFWDRWNASSKKTPYKRINEATFTRYLKYMKSVSWNKKTIDGIIWWSNDIQFYKRNEGGVKAEAKNSALFGKQFNDNVLNYFKKHYFLNN